MLECLDHSPASLYTLPCLTLLFLYTCIPVLGPWIRAIAFSFFYIKKVARSYPLNSLFSNLRHDHGLSMASLGGVCGSLAHFGALWGRAASMAGVERVSHV